MKKLRVILLRTLLVIILLPVIVILCIFLNYHMIGLSTHHKIYTSISEIPSREYTLVLGGGNYRPGWWVNHTFNHRMHTSARLFKSEKTEKIIASGMKLSEELDEVADMKLVLLEYGVPKSAILPDYQGLRTWSSVERSKQIYGADSIIIVSQHGQLERALFIAECIGINAIGMEAEPSPWKHRYWVYREYLARVKCTLDCFSYLFNLN